MKNYTKILIGILLIALAYTLFQYFNVNEHLTIDGLRNTVDRAGPFGSIVFMLIYFIVTLMFFSAALFSVAAGTLFGPVWGVIFVVIAATASAQTAFHISRWFGGDVLSHLGKQSGITQKMTDMIRTRLETGGFRTFFILRCLFLPYIPLSYGAGLVKEARAIDFFFGTLITNAIFSPAFVLFGDNLMKGPRALILPVVLIVIVLMVPKLVSQRVRTVRKSER